MRTLAQPGDGGKDGSRNPFSRRRRSNDEFREAGLVWAARRGSWASPVPQQARAARWSPLACFIFRFLKRPLLDMMERDEATRQRFMDRLDKHLTRADDRALFDLSPKAKPTQD